MSQIPPNPGLDKTALSNLCAKIQADIDDGRMFGASIIVARHGQIALQKSFGTVTPDGRPAADDDLYLLMSLSKSFTAALTLRAIDQGRFNLDTKVAEVLPDFAVGGKQNITIRHLLTHTSGTFSTMLPPGLAPEHMGDLETFVEAVSSTPLVHLPGQRCAYNQAASYALLGQILVASDPAKRRFRDIAHEELFAPLDMKDSAYGLSSANPKRVPVSFTERNTTSKSVQMQAMLNKSTTDGGEIPAGSAYASAHDVFRFAETMRQRGTNGDYRLISKALFDYSCQNHTGTLTNTTWDCEKESKGFPEYPALFSLLGGYVRGEGHVFTGAGFTASPSAFYAVGGGTTMWMVDPEHDLTVVFLSAGFIEGLDNFVRLRTLNDLALSACI